MALFWIPWIWLLVGLAGIGVVDERTRRIPNPTLLALAAMECGWMIVQTGSAVHEAGWMQAALPMGQRMLAALLTFAVSGWIALLKPGALGMGDCKLMAVLMLYFDLGDGLLVLWVSFFLTLLRGMFRILVAKRNKEPLLALPFAPQAAVSGALWFLVQCFGLLGT